MGKAAGEQPSTEAEVRALGRPDPLSNPALFRELREKYLVWDAFFAGQRRVDILPLVLSPRLHREAVAAAEGVVAAVDAAGEIAHDDPEERALYGFHPEVTRLVEASWRAGDRTSFARVDLLLGEDDTCMFARSRRCPGGHNERWACRTSRSPRFSRWHEPDERSERPLGQARRAGQRAGRRGKPWG